MATVNQHLIAEKLSLSIATVSRSLAGNPAISATTRSRVLRAAKELGYKTLAERDDGLGRRQRKMRIGVLVGIQPNSSPLATFPLILKGIQERAQQDRIAIEV